MTTTKIVNIDELVILETFDFRSEFSFDDFLIWLGERLHISVPTPTANEESWPVAFSWDGTTFDVGWDEVHGCYVRVAVQKRNFLERLQAVLTS